MEKQRIVVGLSGGVDSAVTAHLLKQQGHEVVGIFMKNWEGDDDSEYCASNVDFIDAAAGLGRGRTGVQQVEVFGHQIADLPARIKAAVGVLEHHLDVAADGLQRGAARASWGLSS